MSAYFDDNGKTWRYRARVRKNGRMERISGSAPALVNTKAGAIGAEREHIARFLTDAKPAEVAIKAPVLADYVATYQAIKSDELNSSYIYTIKGRLAWIVEEIGQLRLDEINRKTYDQLRAKLCELNFAPSTVNGYLVALTGVMKFAHKRGDIGEYIGPGLLKIPPQDYAMYSEAEINELVSKAGLVMQCAILLGADAGLRRGEIMALQRSDIGPGRLRVMRSVWRGEVKAPKSGQARVVPMTERLGATMGSLLKSHACPNVIIRADGLPWGERDVRFFQPERGWHALRHAFCSRLAAAGVPARQIQELAGHASITTTQRYMHCAPEQLESAIAMLNGRSGQNLAKQEPAADKG